jgi:ankyrin repeat protein
MTTSDLPNELVREYVIAAHFDLPKVKSMLTEHPDLLTVFYDWGAQGGLEDGIGAAAHVGNRENAEFFLSQGVPTNICVAAMLGDTATVRRFLDKDPAQANARGAHGIPVLFHAAMSGNIEVVEMLRANGCNEGYNMALHGAIMARAPKMVEWLLANGVQDVNSPNYQNKTPLAVALENDQADIAAVLRQHGAKE